NKLRNTLSARVLLENAQLNNAAYDKVQDMFVSQYFAHISPKGLDLAYWLKQVGYNYVVAGENLAMGFNNSEEVMAAWEKSPTHYDNLVDSNFSEIGVSFAGDIFNNNENREITPEQVLSQAARYNDPRDTEGHLYGAIIAALREYKKSTLARKYAEYHLAYCAHYAGDLSQPFHNLPNDEYNQLYHHKNDGIVDDEIFENSDRIKANMQNIVLRPDTFEQDLAREIARLANTARYLGLRLKRENRVMTKDEAYRQLGHSASLLRAILVSLGKVH
ncbi:MAG: CAP domain-containing protein, partial [Proteobacteria bacterium]|nr:CAP domain-containing protein [Pseudomonadota bacterium]